MPENARMTVPLLALGFVLLWNSGFIGAEYVLPKTGPFSLLFWRYWTLVLILYGFLRLRGKRLLHSGPAVGSALLVGVLAHGTWLWCVLYALDRGIPAGIVALVVALQPLATGALSGKVAGEPTSWRHWSGLWIGFAGVMVALGPRIQLPDSPPLHAYFVPFGSVVAITLASLMQRRIALAGSAERMPVDVSLFYQALGTALAISLPAVFLENLQTRPDTAFLLTMGWLIVGVSLFSYLLMWLLIERIDATRVASLFYLGPPVTMLMAWAAFGDPVKLFDVVGLLIVVAGVALTTLPRHGSNRLK